MAMKLKMALAATSLVPLLVANGASAQPVHPDVWKIKLGAELQTLGQLNMFADFACGTNGGPPSFPLAKLADFGQCEPEPDGLREIYFRYDDELEYWARANNLDLMVEQNAGTKVYEYPAILSVLVDEKGIIRGLRIVSDARDKSTDRADAYLLGTFLRNRFDANGWDCTELPPGPGESAVNGTFVKESCTKTADGISYRLENRFLRKPGQRQYDPVNGEPTVGEFESITRFEMRQRG